MGLWRKFFRLFFGFENEPELVMAKVGALKQQIPLLYTILIINVIFVCLAHYPRVPWFLSVALPLAISVLALWRAASWIRLDVKSLSIDDATRRLRTTILAVPLIGALFNIWSLTLIQYGGPYEQAHVALFMALTASACMFCLLHLRAAALQLATIALLPFVATFIFSPYVPFRTMAVNVVITVAAMLLVLFRQNRSFIETIRQKHELELKHAETQRLNSENYRLATRDGLTGLANRRSFLTDFAETLRQAKKSAKPAALIIFDLDGFKAVNDIYGHAAGDTLLVKASARLKDGMQDGMYCARMSGDEFAVAIPDFASAADLQSRGHAMITTLSQPYTISQATVSVTASAGVAIHQGDTQTLQELFEQADYALYQAKDGKHNMPVTFDAALQRKVDLLHELDHIFRSGKLEQELSLAYQPIVQVGTLEVTGYEALARWHNGRLGHLTAAEFMESAGRCGMADLFTQTLFRKLLADIPKLPSHVTVSFNLSARDLINPQSILSIVNDVQQAGIVARRLQFEVAETAIAADFDKVLKSLQLLRNMGCAISLNNFGSGQSVLGYIYKLPLDSVKVDASFIRECIENPAARETLKAIVKLCDSLDLTSIAVGIESQAQAEMAESLGCMRLQGYFVSWPLPLSVVLKEPVASRATA